MKPRLFAIIFVLICFVLMRVDLTQSKTIQNEFTIIVTKNKFDNAGRLLNISHTGDNKIYADYYNAENRISKTDKDNKTTKYFWDHRNRLTKVETPTETIEYIYDHQNRLVKRTDNQNTTTFIHDDWQIILQFDNKEPKPTNRYLWGTKQDELICNNNNWTLNDHLNTIRDIVKSDGNVESHLEYNAFGKLISETKNDLPLFAYTGKLTDKSSDLQWNINRWYDSNAGRWMSEDPIGLNADDNNLSRYVNNNTMTNYDLFGLAVHNFFLAGTIRSTTYTKEIKVGNHPVTISVSLEKNVVIHNGTHGQLDHEIGYTSQSFYSACNLSACVPKYWWNKRAGFKFSPRINIVVIVVKLIRPLPSNGNNKEIWLHHLADHNSNKAGTDIVSLAQFESKIINHENHHYQPFVKAVELMKDVVNSHEETKFDTKEEADKDCADNVIPKLGKIWQAALLHSAKYDTEPTWKANSYTSTIYNPFTYP